MASIGRILLPLVAAALFIALPAGAASTQESFEVLMEKGMMRYSIEDYDSAIDILEEAERIRPNDVEVLFYLGQAYEKTGDVEQGKRYFEKAAAAGPDTECGKIAREYLDAFKGGQSKRYFVKIKTGPQYDSNVILKPDTKLIDASNDRSDWKWLFKIKGGYSLPVVDKLDISMTYDFYQTLHFRLDEYDVQSHSLEVFPSYRVGPLTMIAAYKFSYSFFGDESYAAYNGAMAKVVLQPIKKFKAEIYYDYTDKNNHSSNDRDASTHGVAADLYYYFLDNKGSVKLGGFYTNENAVAERYDYDGYGIKAAIGLPLVFDVNLLLDGRYENRDYGNRFSLRHLDTRGRDNCSYIGTVSLDREIYKGIGFTAAYTREENDSNFEEYEYSRNLATLFLTGKF